MNFVDKGSKDFYVTVEGRINLHVQLYNFPKVFICKDKYNLGSTNEDFCSQLSHMHCFSVSYWNVDRANEIKSTITSSAAF